MENRKLNKVALVSVSNKENLLPLLKCLIANNYQILSTGGTAKYCEEHDIPVHKVYEYTNVTEMLDGRVKTLNHKIFAGILHKDSREHIKQVQDQDIYSIDMVVVNCYPFAKVISDLNVSEELAVENIDIGGPSLIRAAAKNHSRVTILSDPNDYGRVIEILENQKDIDAACTLVRTINV